MQSTAYVRKLVLIVMLGGWQPVAAVHAQPQRRVGATRSTKSSWTEREAKRNIFHPPFGFEQARPAGEVLDSLPQMRETMATLSEGSVAIDFGTGMGYTLAGMRDGVGTNHLRYVGITAERRENLYEPMRSNSANHKIFAGRLFEDIPDRALLMAFGDRGSVAWDFHGILAYSPRPDRVLAKMHRLMKVGGRIFVYGGMADPDKYPGTDRIQLADGRYIPVLEYFQRFSGFKLTQETNPAARSPGWKWSSDPERYLVLEKVSEKTTKLPELELVLQRGNKPPNRLWRLKPTTLSQAERIASEKRLLMEPNPVTRGALKFQMFDYLRNKGVDLTEAELAELEHNVSTFAPETLAEVAPRIHLDLALLTAMRGRGPDALAMLAAARGTASPRVAAVYSALVDLARGRTDTPALTQLRADLLALSGSRPAVSALLKEVAAEHSVTDACSDGLLARAFESLPAAKAFVESVAAERGHN
jgi:hypothetical protein